MNLPSEKFCFIDEFLNEINIQSNPENFLLQKFENEY